MRGRFRFIMVVERSKLQRVSRKSPAIVLFYRNSFFVWGCIDRWSSSVCRVIVISADRRTPRQRVAIAKLYYQRRSLVAQNARRFTRNFRMYARTNRFSRNYKFLSAFHRDRRTEEGRSSHDETKISNPRGIARCRGTMGETGENVTKKSEKGCRNVTHLRSGYRRSLDRWRIPRTSGETR